MSRADALREVANSMGYSFEAEDWSFGGLATEIHVPIFERAGRAGKHGTVSAILTGQQAGLRIKLFDYSICDPQIGPVGYNQTMAALSADVELPVFEIAPQNVLHKFADAIVHKDIHFEVNPEFSDRFRLRGLDEERVRRLFTTELLRFLETFEPNTKWHLEGSGSTLVWYRLDHLVVPEEFSQFAANSISMAKTFFQLSGLRKTTS